MPRRSASWTSTVPLPARKPSTKRAPSAAGVPGVSARPTRCDTASASHAPESWSSRVARPPHQPMDRPPVGELGEGDREVVVPGGVVEHRQRPLQTAEPLDHRRRGVVVEMPAGELETGDHAHDDLVDDRRQGEGVRATHVAVAQRRRQRHEGVDQIGDVGRCRREACRGRSPPPARRPGGRRAGRRSRAHAACARRVAVRPLARRPSPWRRRPASSRSSRTRRGARTSPDPRPATTSRGTCCGCRAPPRACPTRRRGCRDGGAGGTGAVLPVCGDRARLVGARRAGPVGQPSGRHARREPGGPAAPRRERRRSHRRPSTRRSPRPPPRRPTARAPPTRRRAPRRARCAAVRGSSARASASRDAAIR